MTDSAREYINGPCELRPNRRSAALEAPRSMYFRSPLGAYWDLSRALPWAFETAMPSPQRIPTPSSALGMRWSTNCAKLELRG